MIIILRGPRAALARRGLSSDLTTRWDVSTEPSAWGALRAMTAQLRAALGDPAVESALQGTGAGGAGGASAPAVALSLVWPRIEAQLTPAQRLVREDVSGARVLDAPGVLPRTSPVASAWAKMIAASAAGRTPLVVVPELDRVDLSTLRAARAVVAATGGVLSMLVSHDTQLAPAGPFEAWLRKLKVRELALLESLPIARVERVDMRSEPAMPRRGSSFEERDPRSIESMRAAFAAYAFDVALRLALELAPKLEGEELREAHALAALSARCLDPHARGDDFGVGMAEAGFLGALDGERDPRKRARWTLELAVLETRVRAESGQANRYADQAVREAEAAGGGYALGWARFARAEARRLAGQHEAATTELDAALAILDTPAVLHAVLREPRSLRGATLDVTRAMVANERARAASALARRDELVHYRGLVDARLAALPPDERPGYDWLTPIDDHTDPASVRTFHGVELARARKALEPEDERAAARAVAGAELCLGNAPLAKELLDVAMRISVLSKRPADEVFGLHLERIVAALRAGAWDDAERDLSLVRADPRCEGDAAQSEALAMLALVSAGKGDVSSLLERSTMAMDHAERSGSPGALTRAGKLAADAWLAVGDIVEARAFAERARGALSAGVRTEDALGLMVTLLACGVGGASMAAEAAEHAASSLDEVGAWWELPRLLPHVLRARSLGVLIDGAALSVLIAAAAQRLDCAEWVAELRAAAQSA